MSFPKSIELIAAERQRQIEVEGFVGEHDLENDDGELALAACYYAMPDFHYIKHEGISFFLYPEVFCPSELEHKWAKRDSKTRIRRLAVAGALIAAEIDRLLSVGNASGENHD
ncbi:MAG: hypothetical protein LBB66_04450 [Desulfovibrio sp.]|nr:hypothetical protein [Desulfovibrio sp.]